MAQTGVVRRSTRQLTVVRELVAELDTLSSAQDIHQLLRSRGESVGLSTVYRNLQALTEHRITLGDDLRR